MKITNVTPRKSHPVTIRAGFTINPGEMAAVSMRSGSVLLTLSSGLTCPVSKREFETLWAGAFPRLVAC